MRIRYTANACLAIFFGLYAWVRYDLAWGFEVVPMCFLAFCLLDKMRGKAF